MPPPKGEVGTSLQLCLLPLQSFLEAEEGEVWSLYPELCITHSLPHPAYHWFYPHSSFPSGLLPHPGPGCRHLSPRSSSPAVFFFPVSAHPSLSLSLHTCQCELSKLPCHCSFQMAQYLTLPTSAFVKSSFSFRVQISPPP